MFRSSAASNSDPNKIQSRSRIPTSSSEAITLLRQPLSPSLQKRRNRKKDDDFCGTEESDDEDHYSIQTAGQEYQAFVRLHRSLFCKKLCGSIVIIAVLALSARGYHHRHQGQLYETEWKRFQKFHITHKHHKSKNQAVRNGDKQSSVELSVSDPSELTPALAQKWNQHKQAAGLSHEKHMNSHYISTKSNDQKNTNDINYNSSPLDQVADGLGLAAEKIGDWVYHGVDQILGHEAATSLHQAASDTFDTVGDLTDQVQDATDEWELTDKVTQHMGEWLSASKESVDRWMGGTAMGDESLNVTIEREAHDGHDANSASRVYAVSNTLQSWANWTDAIRSSIPQKVSTLLWNYTTTSGEDDQNKVHEDEGNMNLIDEEKRTDALKQSVLQQQVSPAKEQNTKNKPSQDTTMPESSEADVATRGNPQAPDKKKDIAPSPDDAASSIDQKKPGVSASKIKKETRVPFSEERLDGASLSLPAFPKDGDGQHRIAYVTTGFPSEEGQSNRFEEYVLAALTTYLDKTVLFYIVNSKEKSFIQKTCAKTENQQACARLIPIYVRCPSLQYGVATCCQMDKGLSQLYEKYSQFDYYVFHQDDLYFRTDFLETFTHSLRQNPQHDAFLMSASPMRYHGQRVYEYPLTKEKLQTFHDRHDCSRAPNHLYPWGRPALIYSNAALRQAVPVYKNAGVTKECEAFSVTADAAAPIVHWMMQLPLLKLPSISATIPDTIAQVYSESALDRGLDDGGKPQYHALQRTIAFRVDNESYNFTSLHSVLEPESNPLTAEERFPVGPYKLNWHRPFGFQETSLFQSKGPVQNWTRWETFGPQDCISHLDTKEVNGRVPGKWMGYHPDNEDVREYMRDNGIEAKIPSNQQTERKEERTRTLPQRSLLRERNKRKIIVT